MKTIHGFPYVEIQFDKEGTVHDATEVGALGDLVDLGVTDLLVVSHGWNNDMDDARKLYDKLLKKLRSQLGDPDNAGAAPQIGVLAVLWPSKKFANSELIASGAASTGASVNVSELQAQIATLKGGFDEDSADSILDQLSDLAPTINGSKRSQDEFYSLAMKLVDTSSLDDEVADEIPDGWGSLEGRVALDELSKPPLATERGATGQPDAAGFGFLSGIVGAAQSLLNLLTFYQMKHRAGVVGEGGLNGVLRDVAKSHPSLRIHLVGHSFGARVVAAALRGEDGSETFDARSLTLLQAAFSHNGLAEDYEGTKDGYFRIVLDDARVTGPIVITHTRNDKAVGIAYPLASRLQPVNASAIVGGPTDPYGGMGRNGAQNTPEAVAGKLEPKGHSYSFADGKVHNLNSDQEIADHGDVANEAVASALVSVLAN